VVGGGRGETEDTGVRPPSGGGADARVAGDEVYGADPALRAELEARAIGYALVGMATTTSVTRPHCHYRRQATQQPEHHDLRLEY
jgi:hypothetical protein